jgi:integrase
MEKLLNTREVAAMLRVADGWGWLARTPKLFVVKQHRITLPDIVFIKTEDLPILLKYSSAKWRFNELLGTRAGLRPIEITRLLKTDMDWKNRLGHIRPAKASPKKGIFEFDPKTYESRTFKITDEMLEAYAALPQGNSPYVVTNEYGEPFATTSSFGNSYKKHLKIISRKIGEDWRKEGKEGSPLKFEHPPKVWRKTFGSHLIIQGVDLYVVSKLLGHKNVLVTQRHYAALLEEQYQKFVLALPRLKF